MSEPIIICPYVFDSDVEAVRRAFHLDEPSGRRLPFFLWKDENRLGPEIAMETSWKQFPDRDIIIIHSDMSPMPDDLTNRWYDDLLGYVSAMPEAGMLGCDLLYPMRSATDEWLVQSAGGYFRDGKISWIGGGVEVSQRLIGDSARPYTDELRKVRRADWVTFGGVYIRRTVLDACGPFDRRYRWAYVMDVDYCLEARTRGFQLFQVPVTLVHFESQTLKQFDWMSPEKVAQLDENHRLFYEKWGSRLAQLATQSVYPIEVSSSSGDADIGPKLNKVGADGAKGSGGAEKAFFPDGSFAERYENLIAPLFKVPTRLPLSAWTGHIPFLFVLFHLLRPRTYLELGVFAGASLIAACTAARSVSSGSTLFGVDTWQSDPHSGSYDGDAVFADIKSYLSATFPEAKLMRSSFREARRQFLDGSIDVLHIDGYHTYEAVKNDFITWFSAVAPQGVILFHDIAVYEREFGVHRLWDELKKQFTTIEFRHSFGLGVLFRDRSDRRVAQLVSLFEQPESREFYCSLVADIANALPERVGSPAPQAIERGRQLTEDRQSEHARDSQLLDRLLHSTYLRIVGPGSKTWRRIMREKGKRRKS